VLRMKVFFIFSPDDGDSICWLAQTGMPIRFLVTRLTEDRTCQPISVRIQLHTAFSYCISHVTAHLVEMNNSYCNQYLGHVNNQKNMSNPKCFLFWCIHRMSQITFLFLYSCHLFWETVCNGCLVFWAVWTPYSNTDFPGSYTVTVFEPCVNHVV
jgi:hypothetical protein